jgi:DNA-binding CsgD family transcriptional regulator
MQAVRALKTLYADGGVYADNAKETALRIAVALDDLAGISSCSTVADLRALLHTLARALGFYGCRYIHLGHVLAGMSSADSPPPVRFLSTSIHDNFGPEDENWMLCDPVISNIRSSFTPFPWSTQPPRDATPVQRRWLDRERALGVGAGLAVPVQDYVGGPAYLSFFGVDEATAVRLMDEQAAELAFFGAQFHLLAKTLVPITGGSHEALLTPREIDCLRLAALGRTTSQSGKDLGISENTVEFHLKKVSRKLGTGSKLRAVALAVSAGLIRV